MINESLDSLLTDVNQTELTLQLETLAKGESRYIKDLRITFKNAIQSFSDEKDAYLLALAIAYNDKNLKLISSFEEKAKNAGANESEVAEMNACASLLAMNNILYRFRHFTQNEVYEKQPAKIRMNVMVRPVTGKPFFELVSLAISAVNGCEMCVNAHEKSVRDLGINEEQIFNAIRLASVVTGMGKVI